MLPGMIPFACCWICLFSGSEVSSCYARPSAHADRLLALPVSICCDN